MKGKMKKIIAAVATLAMVAQFAFVLPASADKASADDVYVKTTFASGDVADWTPDSSTTLELDGTALKMSGGNSSTQVTKSFNVTQANPIMYYDFVWNNGVSNGRAGGYNYIKIGDFELRAYGADSKSEMIVGGQTKTLSGVAVKDTDVTVSLVVETLTNKLTYSVKWGTADESGTVSLTSGVSYKDLVWGYSKPGRITSSYSHIKSFSLKAETDTRQIRDITFTVDGKNTVAKVVDGDKVSVLDIPSYPLKLGGYRFTKWKDSETNDEYTAEEIAALTVTADKTYVAQFVEDQTSVERITGMSIKTHPVIQPELPVKNPDGSDNSLEYDVELTLPGEAGNDIASESYAYPKGNLEVTWSIDGFDSLKGVSTGEPDTRDGKLIYCDSYMELTGFTGNATKGKIKLTSGIGNYFGKFKVHVKYGTDTVGYREFDDEFPLIILADANKPANQIYPLGGYFENLNWYSDSLLGYSALGYNTDNSNNPDPFLSGWCLWGGRTTKEMSLQKDTETGDKYLLATNGSATNSSGHAAFYMGSLGEQAYIDTDVQFLTSGEIISLKHVGERNSDDKREGDAYKAVAYKAVHTTPYSNGMSFNGSALVNGENSVGGLETGKWYRLRISFDDSAQEFWYELWNIDDTKRVGESGRIGTSLGKTAAIPYDKTGTALPYTSNYFVLTPSAGVGHGMKIKNMTMYKPEMTTFTATTDAETLTIPEGVSVATTNIDATKNTVKVTAEKAAVTAEVSNKTSDSEKVNAFVVCYTEGSTVPAKVTMGSATVAGGATKLISVNVPTDAAYVKRKLFVWTDQCEPLIEAKEFQLDTSDKADPTAKLSTIKKDADGNDLSGNVTWSLAEEYEGVTLSADPDNANNAILTVAGSASPGEVYAIAANRGQTSRVKVTLTGSADNVAFLNPTTSVTIPFDDTPSTATYSAEVRNGDGDKINDKTVTYALYDANNAQPLANTAAISFDPATATLSVTNDAKGQIVYIRGTSTNTDGEPISKSVKVTIHGLSFDFGASDEEGVAEGYTAVTPSTAYTDERGYGISGNATAGGTASDTNIDSDYIEATGDMTFRVKVPEGKNYKLKVTYKGAMSTEAIDSDCSGVTRTANASLTRSTYNVAVIGDSLDFKVTDGQIASVEIEMLAAKEPAAKPTWFTYGDSTTNSSSGGKISWANRVQNYTTKFNVSNTAKSGSNPSTFYNGGHMDNILLNIAEGDLVTFNGMGTNSYTGNFKSEVLTLIKACEDRGAIVIMTTYTPHGAVSSWSDRYHSSDQTFHGARDTDGYTTIYREVAEELGKTIIDFGAIGDKAMNDLVDAASASDATVREAKAQELIGHFLDHNHYDETMANIFAEVYAPPVEAMYDTLVNAD